MTEKIESGEVSPDELDRVLGDIFAEEAQVEAKRKNKKIKKAVKPENLIHFVEKFKEKVGYDKPFKILTVNILKGLGEETTKVVKDDVPVLDNGEPVIGEDGLPIIDKVKKTVEREDLPTYVRKALMDAVFDVIKVQNVPAYELYLYNPEDIIVMEMGEELSEEDLEGEEEEEISKNISIY